MKKIYINKNSQQDQYFQVYILNNIKSYSDQSLKTDLPHFVTSKNFGLSTVFIKIFKLILYIFETKIDTSSLGLQLQI